MRKENNIRNIREKTIEKDRQEIRKKVQVKHGFSLAVVVAASP